MINNDKANLDPQLFVANGRPYLYSELKEEIRLSGITEGTSVFVHSDIGRFGTLAEVKNRDLYTGYFLNALLEAVGKSGTLMMPTFTYSFCKKEVFSPLETPSTVGILTEAFRKIAGAKRSLEGIFSIAAFGPQSAYFTDVGQDCFGENSIFDKLKQKNAIILFLGETFDITYMHHVEQSVGVDYRFPKLFPGEIKIDGALKPFTFNYLVRDLEVNIEYDLEGIADFLNRKGVLVRRPLGASKLRTVYAKDAFIAIAEGLKENPSLLIKK